MSEIHVAYKGQKTFDFNDVFSTEALSVLGISGTPTASTLSESQISDALARHMDVPRADFNDMYIERNANGNITVRPNAVWG